MIKRIITPLLLLSSVLTAAHAATYYVDSKTGSDSSSGLSARTPWKTLAKVNSVTLQPGDWVLFRAGSVFTGQLKPQGSGLPGKPVLLSSYGSGPQPLLAANGTHRCTLWLYNVQNYIVQNLQITNTGPAPAAKRTGVLVSAWNSGVMHNITLRRLYIHDVNGSEIKNAGGGAGIAWQNGGSKVKSRFDGLTIEYCHLVRTDRNGIVGAGYWQRSNWYPSLHVVIQHNLLEHIGGDGIVPIGCDGCLVQYNVMRNSGWNLPMGEYAAGIWPWSCDNTVVQFNEVSGQRGGGDAQGFDSDWNCRNTLIQYNYSHDNEGGFLLVCNDGSSHMPYSAGNQNTVVRYNLSVNDGYRITGQQHNSPAIHFAGPTSHTLIYNNTIVAGPKPAGIYDNSMVIMNSWNGYASDTLFENNIFYTADTAGFSLGQTKGTLFKNNLYYGPQPSRPQDEGAKLFNPLFAGPLTPAEGKKYWLGFVLKQGSPAAEAGIAVPDNGGRDLAGAELPAGNPALGALQPGSH